MQRLALAAAVLGLAGCASSSHVPVSAGTGPHPELPPPDKSLIPVVHVVDAGSWPEGRTPVAAQGLAVSAFARGLDHPRWLYVLPNGDVLVAETNAPERPQDNRGIKGWFFKHFQKKAGGTVPSPDRITLLRDGDGDGVAETRSVLLSGLHSPFGMALVGDSLYVADTDAVMRFPYKQGETRITAPGVKVAGLPAGPINHHWTKSLVASSDGSKLY
ncbi:MAG: sorbosone dehydrogenase family protein, partial [Thermoanaerobaculia bacterium]